MNPLEEYISIIHQRQQNPLSRNEYGEVHHIIPRSLGGCNRKWNLVKLTPEEHYRCHYWLTFIYAVGEEHKKMVFAWNWLTNRIRGEFISAEEYGRLKREYHSLNLGHTSWNKGKRGLQVAWNKGKTGIYTDETRRRISEAKLGRPAWNKGTPHTEETKEKIRQRRIGHRASEETKSKMSLNRKGRPWSAARRLAYERKYGVA